LFCFGHDQRKEDYFMQALYQAIQGIHNLVGLITIGLTIAAAYILLGTGRTSSNGAGRVLRFDAISASVQALLGIVLVVIGWLVNGAGYIASFWLHYLLGIVAVGVISVAAARGRRAPDSAARTYGIMFLVGLVLVAVTWYIGFFQVLV
jgi:hypothetical protein